MNMIILLIKIQYLTFDPKRRRRGLMLHVSDPNEVEGWPNGHSRRKGGKRRKKRHSGL